MSAHDAPIPPDLERRFDLREEEFRHRSFRVQVLRPRSPEELIDVTEFNEDERLPYWAELWPSARALARAVLEAESLPDHVVELGCGVGLPSLALLWRGVDVLATDYYADALRFARLNAERNGLPPLRTRELDWRVLPEDLPRFPLALAADVLYEARNVAALAGVADRVLERHGELWLADPRRSYLALFLERMAADGWVASDMPDRLESIDPATDRRVAVRLVRLKRR